MQSSFSMPKNTSAFPATFVPETAPYSPLFEESCSSIEILILQ